MEVFSRHERVNIGKPRDHLELSMVGGMNDNRKNLYRDISRKIEGQLLSGTEDLETAKVLKTFFALFFTVKTSLRESQVSETTGKVSNKV